MLSALLREHKVTISDALLSDVMLAVPDEIPGVRGPEPIIDPPVATKAGPKKSA